VGGTYLAVFEMWGSACNCFRGKRNFIPAEGATPYSRDLKNIETHLLDTGHWGSKPMENKSRVELKIFSSNDTAKQRKLTTPLERARFSLGGAVDESEGTPCQRNWKEK